MKNIYKIATGICLSASSFCINAQTTVTIPSANPQGAAPTASPYRKPYGTTRAYERTAIKYTQAEIGMIGNITDIAFYVDSINNPGFAVTKIYMKEVPDSTFTVSTVATEETGATLVYSDTIFPGSFVKGQWTNVTLSAPFLHATTNNIEVIIETNSGGTAGTDGATTVAKGFRYSPVTGAREQYWQSATGSGTIPAGNGTLVNNNRLNVQFIITPAAACSAPPTAGTAMANPMNVCANGSTVLSLQGNGSGIGMTYQWLSSPDGITWTPIGGATSVSYNATGINAVTYFECVLTCTAQNDTSTSVMIGMNPFYNCYCNTALGGNCATTAIDSVAIVSTTLANGLTGCAPTFYTAYPASGNTTALLTQGQTYSLVTKYNGVANSSVWIDYDQNGVFDTYEWTLVTAGSTAGVNVNSSISIPLGSTPGMTGMRIRSRSTAGTNDSTVACTTFGSGETEDYLVTIVATTPCSAPPTAGTTIANPTSVCAGQMTNLSLNGSTTGTGQTFQWISSTDGGVTWNVETGVGATTPIYSDSVFVQTWYACVLTCSAQNDTSIAAQVNVNPFYQCYCVAANGAGCTGNAATTIDSVAITGTALANGPTGCSNSYIAYPGSGSTSAILNSGWAYTFNAVLVGNAKLGFWIDYDQSGTFDIPEWTSVCQTSVAGVNNAMMFSVPSAALNGMTGMRVRSRSTAGTLDSTSACTAFGTGETEDYLVTIATPLGISNSTIDAGKNLYIFPNPTNGILNVGVNLSAASRLSYQIINLNGEVVYNEQAGTQSGVIKKTLDLSGMPKGIYFVKVISDKEVMLKKVVLQ